MAVTSGSSLVHVAPAASAIMAAFSSTSATHTGTRTSTPRMIFQLRPLTDTMTKFSSCFLPLGSSTVVIFSFISPFSFPLSKASPAGKVSGAAHRPGFPPQFALSSSE